VNEEDALRRRAEGHDVSIVALGTPKARATTLGEFVAAARP
jgi:hypothetical protein